MTEYREDRTPPFCVYLMITEITLPSPGGSGTGHGHVLRDLQLVYYESIKRELNKRLLYECQCDERLKDKVEGSTRLCFF
jgi:hypothetical protein